MLEALAWNRVHQLDGVRARLDAELGELARVRAELDALRQRIDHRG